MSSFTDNHVDYYKPLIKEFLDDIKGLEHPDIEELPEPFLPLFGNSYEKSAMRLVIIGQDTLGWGDLREFIDSEYKDPGCNLRERLEEFRNHAFRNWGQTRQRFWGFSMMMLSALHGQEEWTSMKHGKMAEILDSFAWSEGNAIELFGSTAKGLGTTHDYWNAIRKAGERFNRFRHIAETLKPNAALILYRGLNHASYFEGYKYEVVSQDGRLTHYRLPEIDVDIIHAPHPGSMNRFEGTDQFKNKIREIFEQHKITVPFPEFLTGQAEGSEVIEYMLNKAPKICSTFDKYAFVDWVAEELAKRNAFMSIPALMNLVNSKGGETNYGTPFSGRRGSYKLVSGTYHRLIENNPDSARRVAEAFRRPNFEYAYDAY